MPAKNSLKLLINLDLLRPQSNPEKLPIKFLKWLFSSGRILFILVEAIVLTAFILRFKLDADIATKKDSIDQQAAFIQSLKSYEILIKETQLKLSTIQNFRSSSIDYNKILNKIAGQTPAGVKIITLNINKSPAETAISISAQAQDNNDLSSFIAGLKQEFNKVTLSSIGVEQGLIRFSINANEK